ncbi:MAG: hypothetical protein KTR16_06760 [Acidiferrobacterales bacterium]|nr:hypothetical protein [Acidiferrobacterales bacterium]
MFTNLHFLGLKVSLLFFCLKPALAHHTWAVDYDADNFVEIEGTVSSIRWVNPHVRFEVTVNQGVDTEQTWSIAGTSVSNLARMDVNRGILQVGDSVRMAGHASKKSEHAMYMINLLLPDGREAVFSGSARQRWTAEKVGSNEAIRGEVAEQDISARPNSIFSVWTVSMGDPGSRSLQPRKTEDFPLSKAGVDKIASYNPKTDNPFGSCAPKGGVAVMDAPYPIELVDEGDKILFKLEEYDTVREIHLNDIHDDSNIEPSLLGYSTGRWQGDTLLITTSKISYPYMHVGSTPDYVPQSAVARIQETLRLGEKRDKLFYTLTITDTEMLTEPLVLSRYYVWRPNESIQPYSCDEEGLFLEE